MQNFTPLQLVRTIHWRVILESLFCLNVYLLLPKLVSSIAIVSLLIKQFPYIRSVYLHFFTETVDIHRSVHMNFTKRCVFILKLHLSLYIQYIIFLCIKLGCTTYIVRLSSHKPQNMC